MYDVRIVVLSLVDTVVVAIFLVHLGHTHLVHWFARVCGNGKHIVYTYSRVTSCHIISLTIQYGSTLDSLLNSTVKITPIIIIMVLGSFNCCCRVYGEAEVDEVRSLLSVGGSPQES